MNKKRFLSLLSLILVLLMTGFGEWSRPVLAQSGGEPGGLLADVVIEPGRIVWEPLTNYDGWLLSVGGSDQQVFHYSFQKGMTPVLEIQVEGGRRLADGLYQYELRPVTFVEEEMPAAGRSAQENGDGRRIDSYDVKNNLPDQALVQTGVFTIADGAFISTSNEIEPENTPGEAPTATDAVILDILQNDDVIMTGSLCVGFDCVNGESFGFDTIRLKENNLRIHFDDTSNSASFPANDWRITVNDSANGGGSYFAIDDATVDRSIFKIEAGAPANSLYVEDYGRVGLGTSMPVLMLHISDGDSPGIRLDQDGSSGWAPQVWDIVGNEANFFIRDVTDGSKLPFRIQPGAATNTLTLGSDLKIGFGTWSPEFPIELERTGQDAAIVAQRTDGASAIVTGQVDSVQLGALTDHPLELVVNNLPVMTIDAQGNATLNGALYEHSDRYVKKDFQPVDRAQVLDQVMGLSISTWSYQSDEPGVRHMGPMAQDFYEAFGLGADDTHISALDVNGVALAAVQELLNQVNDQNAQINQLETDNRSLSERLDALEDLVNQLLAQKGLVLTSPNQSRAGFTPCQAR